MNRSIDISPRKKQLKEEYERLQQEYAALVAERDEMTNAEGPRLTALYMDAVGQLQYEILVLQYEIALLKQKRDLLQAYKNRREKPDMEKVEEQVEQTAKTYNERIYQEEEKIKQAKEFIEEQQEEEKKGQEDSKRELRDLYRKLVHRLHPDLHPEQTEWERELFLKVQDAYEKGDLDRLRELAEQLEAGMPTEAVDNDTTEEWEERVNRLKEEIAKIREEIADMLGQTQNREQVIARFQNSADCQFFLISLKAGGVGLNLTAADYVFLLDPWWNRAAEEQAIARAHRIGQQRSVFVYRFVSAGTLEEQILTLQDRKQSLIDSVMPFICKP